MGGERRSSFVGRHATDVHACGRDTGQDPTDLPLVECNQTTDDRADSEQSCDDEEEEPTARTPQAPSPFLSQRVFGNGHRLKSPRGDQQVRVRHASSGASASTSRPNVS